jgi:pimeloyl-ACP methyl ester carboxylesterase
MVWNLCKCRFRARADGGDDQASRGKKKKEEEEQQDAVAAAAAPPPPQCYTDIFYEHPPQELVVRARHGNTAVHVFNAEAADTVFLMHGAGGRKEQFAEGRVAQCLASAPYRVVTFDWYGHGGSAACDTYNKENFLEQMESVITELVPDKEQRFHLYAFSMGCFIALHYIRSNPDRIDHFVLHSPWNAEMSAFCPYCCIGGGSAIRCSVRIPLLGLLGVAILRHLLFPYCHDAVTLKKIVVTLGEGWKAWQQLLDSLVKAPGTPERMLIICGQREKPFFRVARKIHETFNETSEMKTYRKAHHMTWCEHWDQQVGEFFRGQIYNFLKQKQ